MSLIDILEIWYINTIYNLSKMLEVTYSFVSSKCDVAPSMPLHDEAYTLAYSVMAMSLYF